MSNEEIVYSQSTASRDLESRLSDTSKPPVFNESVDPIYVDGNGFVGVDPIYANAANETDYPLAADGGTEQKSEDRFDAALEPATNEVPADFQAAYEKVTRPDVPGASPKASGQAAESPAATSSGNATSEDEGVSSDAASGGTRSNSDA